MGPELCGVQNNDRTLTCDLFVGHFAANGPIARQEHYDSRADTYFDLAGGRTSPDALPGKDET